MKMNRRTFVHSSIVASAASRMLIPSFSRNNEPLRIAVVGFRSRGKALIKAIHGCNNAQLVGLCDVDEKILAESEPDNSKLIRVDDFRRLLDRDDIDVIASATPNHWHTAIAMHSVMAGKHVYIEKPISHNMRESRMVVAAAEATGKLIQCGFQNRSDTALSLIHI